MKILAFSGKMQTFCRAGLDTFAAADTFRGTGYLLERKRHRAGVLTCSAGYAGVPLPMDLNQTEAVEPAVDCTQRAQILAEGAVNFHGEKQKKEQYAQLPEEQSPSLATKWLVCRQQRDSAKQCAGGTDIFAKCGNLGKSTEQKRGANPHKEKQRYIRPIFQDMVQGELLFLMKDRYFV